MGKKNNNKNHKEFSKVLLIQESALIWVLTFAFIGLAFFCIHCGYTGSLPWLAAMVGFPWTAYGVSQVFYYRKSMKENSKGGIKFESVMAEIQQIYGNVPQLDWTLDTQSEQNENNVIYDSNQKETTDNSYTPDIYYGI